MSHAWHRLVTTLEERFADLETRFHEAYWASQVKASPENERRRNDLELALRRLKGDPEAYAQVNEALEEDIHDPLLRRQLEILRLSLTGNQMRDEQRAVLVELSTAVESEFASYRPQVDGRRLTENDIDEILTEEDDEDLRRRAWEASKEVGGRVAERVRELARLRNEVARDLGYGDYYQLGLDLQELDEDWLFGVLDELERLTDEPFQRWKADLDSSLAARFNTSTLYPWHYADPFFQSLPRAARVNLEDVLGRAAAEHLSERTFSSWGIDLSPVMRRSDLYPRENKSQHAFCLHVDRADDVRILANIVPGERWVEIMLHESGHAAYDVGLDRTLPYLLRRAAHIFVTEAIAIMSARMMRRPTWLIDVAGADPTGVAEIEDRLIAATAAQSLLFTRWGLAVVHFERALYADPEGDLDARWWELVERFQLVNPPPGRSQPDWAAKIHIAAAPVYYQNYLLGEMLASQLEATCETECGGLVGNEAAGRLLAERIYSKGNSMRWDELIHHATGSRLEARHFAGGVVTV